MSLFYWIFFFVHWKHILVTVTLLYWEALLCDLQCHRQDQILPKSTGWAAWYNRKEYGTNKEPGRAIQHSYPSGLQRYFPAWNTDLKKENKNKWNQTTKNKQTEKQPQTPNQTTKPKPKKANKPTKQNLNCYFLYDTHYSLSTHLPELAWELKKPGNFLGRGNVVTKHKPTLPIWSTSLSQLSLL